MSFFGFDTALPRDRPDQTGGSSQGMFDRRDPFGGLSREGYDDTDDQILDFEETYDGLGQQLKESGDAFNDDTFGGEDAAPATRQSVGRDFDFAGQTASMRGELHDERTLHQARQPMQYSQAPAPRKTGYEAYKEPSYIPKLEADASIWGNIGKKQVQQATPPPLDAGRKMMSLEEVEAMMRSQPKPTQSMAGPVQDMTAQSQGLRDMLGVGASTEPPHGQHIGQQQQHQQQQQQQQQRPVQILQRPQQPFDHQGRPQDQLHSRQPHQYPSMDPPHQNLHAGQAPAVQPPFNAPMGPAAHGRGPSFNIPQNPDMMSPEEREAFMAEEAKRAKRNHKIHLLSRNNGMMTPQDKNFITRIQLQQLLTATGGIENAPGSEDQLAEDFYYQVYAQIREPPRNRPGQPLNQFAQTYLLQTGTRYGYGRSRHHPRGGDNHIQRMEQQVARAVEAAKARPKNKSLVVAGSLGKIAFSNSKTPRPLLNIKRPEAATAPRSTASKVADRKAALRDIETIYTTLMKLEDHERKLPPPPNEESPPEVIEGHMRWRTDMQLLNEELWSVLKVMGPLQQNPSVQHPFVQILSHSKGKKVLPRVFRHLDEQQRLTMLTLIVLHLDSLDVIRDAYPGSDDISLPARVKEEVELFNQAVMPPLFSFVNDAPLNIIIGLIDLMLDRVHVHSVVRTKIGLSILTMLISRAELVSQGNGHSHSGREAEDRSQWQALYSRFFDTVEPVLPYIFPTDTNISAADDMYVWQFLAAMGVGASPDEQQRLVLGVKDRVMETVGVSKSLPQDMATRRLDNVNLFLRAIGLDVELLG